MIVAGGQDTPTNSKWNILELWPIQLFDCCVEGITINMDYILSEIATDFKLGDESIGIAFVTGKILLVEGLLASYDLLDLLGEDLVLDLFAIEEF